MNTNSTETGHANFVNYCRTTVLRTALFLVSVSLLTDNFFPFSQIKASPEQAATVQATAADVLTTLRSRKVKVVRQHFLPVPGRSGAYRLWNEKVGERTVNFITAFDDPRRQPEAQTTAALWASGATPLYAVDLEWKDVNPPEFVSTPFNFSVST